MTEALLSVKGLRKYFPVVKGIIRSRLVGEIKAVDGVNFEVMPGETLGLVGESGGGKTTTGRVGLGRPEPRGGGGERVWQDDHWAARPASARTQRRAGVLPRRGAHQSAAARHGSLSPKVADHLPGPLCQLEPAHHRRRCDCRAPYRPWP